MQTCQNNLDLNLYVVFSTSYVIIILEDIFIRSYKKEIKHVVIDIRDLALTLVNYQASYYKVITSLKYIK